jgi:hypothetical protein
VDWLPEPPQLVSATDNDKIRAAKGIDLTACRGCDPKLTSIAHTPNANDNAEQIQTENLARTLYRFRMGSGIRPT